MVPLLAAALFAPGLSDPPTPPQPPAPSEEVLMENVHGFDVEVWDDDLRKFTKLPPGRPAGEVVTFGLRPDGTGSNVLVRQTVPLLSLPRSAGPMTGTLKLTAPDGTVTEYQAEFTPNVPSVPPPPPKHRLGVALDSMEPTGDPPGLAVRSVLTGSAAAQAGMKDGDRIISVDGEPLTSFKMLRDEVAEAAEGEKPLAVKVVRPSDDGEEDRILQFEVKPETIDLTAEPWKPIPIETGVLDSGEPFQFSLPLETGVLDSGEPFQFSVGPATVRPAESPEIRVERAKVRIRAAQAQVELAEQQAERAAKLAERGVGSRDDVLAAKAKLAAVRATLEEAELDRRAAEQEADRSADTTEIRQLRERVDALAAKVVEQAEEIERLQKAADR
ncbi:PDZ domain-containing protein [Alienimonas chondri]|uniref:PDZ domain-containing protein n=1 Tax=Alienimonas chondri TaxID=2681879 RepID=A0ABX1VJK5_9PLAN|nr:PDZ domain-containing protein [Alienimonas chondri]NNJ27952.1 hypothetical protein [Alienimonas chondri]